MYADEDLIPHTKIAIFKGKNIRKTLHNNEWWFSVVDVCAAVPVSPELSVKQKKFS